MQHDWFMYHLRSAYKNRLDFPFKDPGSSQWGIYMSSHVLWALFWSILILIKGEVSPNNNVDRVSRKQFYKPNSKSLSRLG